MAVTYQTPSSSVQLSLTCSYKPAGGSGNGSSSAWFGFNGTAAVHGNGMTYTYADGHSKFRSLTVGTRSPNQTNGYVEPWVFYDASNKPQSAWTDGAHLWLFRPDYNFQP
jgi:prepilin-type processing-associated H-X9-DG protein